jgi:hypothetical protein
MKIIFLDIDGVLNHQRFYKERFEARKQDKLDGNLVKKSQIDREAEEIDPESVENLNELIENTGAKVVISSTWRLGTEIETLQAILEKRGFVGEVIGKTPVGCGCCQRGNEIHKWLGDNRDIIDEEGNNYIILDDDSDMLYWQRNNFINVDQYVGLTPKQVYKATRFLTGIGQL